uniref:DUF6702 family protein n=2 Tax=Gelidibacter sp. TaxID=2018083 RepID=UPI00404B9CC1
MRILKISCCIIAFTLFTSLTMHKFYVSVTQVEFVKEQQSVQIISRIFIDDLELALQNRYDKNIKLIEEKESENVDAFIEKYFNQKLKIYLNSKESAYKFLGKKYENDILYFYFEIENVKDVKQFQITNQILFDALPDQQNIVKIKAKSEHKNYILTTDNDKALLNF